MSTKAQLLADPNSCLNKAEDDEEVFLLRAKDRLFYLTVMYWQALSAALEVHETEREAEARRCARNGARWRRDKGLAAISDLNVPL